jgi:hypothetical protein
MIQHQVQIKQAGFHIAERLAEIVDQSGEVLFVECRGAHVYLPGQGSV